MMANGSSSSALGARRGEWWSAKMWIVIVAAVGVGAIILVAL